MKNTVILIIAIVILLSGVVILCDALIKVDRVDLKNYPVTLDYGTLSKQEKVVFLDILDAVGNGISSVQYDGEINKYKILTHLGLYYGSMENICGLFSWSSTKIYLHLDAFQLHEDMKIVIDARVDEAVSTLKEGSERFKLWQIANYISEKMTYTYGIRETIDGLNGQGVCSTYAMLFYKMASRLGIETYICYGFTVARYHAWNMVVLDGESYYYDVTWCDDVILNPVYIHSRNSWGREYMINNRWACCEIKEKEESI